VIIATACIEWNFDLLHNDRDYDALQQIPGLHVHPLARRIALDALSK
jgi:hypothetical protein